jgi:hypothetical protein
MIGKIKILFLLQFGAVTRIDDQCSYKYALHRYDSSSFSTSRGPFALPVDVWLDFVAVSAKCYITKTNPMYRPFVLMQMLVKGE